MKLNLGCGVNRKPGYVNVDREAAASPDLVVDLERLPWPWPADSVDAVVMEHVLEHLGRDTDTYLGIFRELYRVCRDGAEIRIVVPHPRHDVFLNDPTHVRAVTRESLELFSLAKNREWAASGAANTQLARFLGIDFEIVSAMQRPSEPWLSRYARGEIDAQALADAARHFNNVIEEITVVLRALKPAP
jgi:SAM-dependent methyltransferase